ncbi:hypothetical protein THITE_2171095 [Paecilomyces variotii No. 5]|uniref:FAD synthase n=1 Tax=Byssochlamys spectabilis (strain No. 5 / NBRC 109023) TaxID=1356009 RepID=V5G434_BYSSN|nr:hypothetical protein THITE_2171095 [Paecilomyces variotii No. 5]
MTGDLRIQQHDSQVNGIANAPPRTLLEICNELKQKVTAFLEQSTEDELIQRVQGQVRTSMQVIEEALRRYRLEELSLSYNGGKDCLVLLVLILACLPNLTASSTGATLRAIYIVSHHPFPEVEAFVQTSATYYHLDLIRYMLPIRDALETYLREKPTVKAIFVGTRRTDPHGERLTHFDPTDPNWPQFMRIHPVIDWNYVDIWTFIRQLRIPYCNLYNEGFTSLGGMTDTHPNPALARKGDVTSFRPAYELVDDDEERLGRSK